MAQQRAHVVIPTELVHEIDAAVGPRKRSKFFITAAQKELLRLRQLEALKKSAGAWAKHHHPELLGRDGPYRFVRKLRQESERRFKRLPPKGAPLGPH